MKIALIIGHFGSVPGWYPLWKESALRNPSIEFHIFTDCQILESVQNIHIHLCKLDIFSNHEFYGKTKPVFDTPYKITDFRPVFGEIFEAILENYDYWGFGDLDVIYGDLQSLLGSSFGKYDYISTGRDGKSGPLAFLANTSEVNRLWHDIDHVHERLCSKEFFAMDEIDFVDLLLSNVRCDLVFRECLDDLPARWQDGALSGIRSGKPYALHHFGGTLSHTRKQIVRDVSLLVEAMQQGKPLRIGHDAGIHVETPLNTARDNTVFALRRMKRRLV